MTRAFSCIAVAVFVAALASHAFAHDVWLTVNGDAENRQAIVNYGHPDDRPPVLPDKIIDLIAISGMTRIPLDDSIAVTVIDGHPVARTKLFRDDGHTLLAARYDNGLWVKRIDGSYRNATRMLVPNAVESLWSVKFAKAVTGTGAPWATPLGHLLEIVPLADPGAVKPGANLRLRVLFEGKPLSGIAVERGDGVTPVPENDIPRFTTDGDGIATVPIVKAGAHLLVADHKVAPSRMPAMADGDLYNATLWFVVRE